MKVLSLKEFRKNMSKVFKGKERILITDRGKAVYMLEPADPADEFLLWVQEANEEIERSGIANEEVMKLFQEARDEADRKIRRS
jgi:hypothetical protein